MSDQFVELVKGIDIELLKSAYLWKEFVDLAFGLVGGFFTVIGCAAIIVTLVWSLNYFDKY